MKLNEIFTVPHIDLDKEYAETPYDYELLSKLSKKPVPLTDMNKYQLEQLPRLVQVGIVKIRDGFAHMTEVGENWFRGWEESKQDRAINATY